MFHRKSVRIIALALFLCAALCIPAKTVRAEEGSPGLTYTDEEQAYIDSHSPVRVGFVQDRIPVSFSDERGQLAGISRYIFDRIAEISGMKFEYVPLPAGSITYDFLINEKLDLVTSVEYNKENLNAKGILISSPYLSSRKVIVARRDLDFSYSKHLNVAVSTGSQTLRKVLQDTYPNFVLQDYDSITDCFDAVKSGKADLMIQNQYVVEYWISKPAYDKLKVIPALGLDDELCFSAMFSFDEQYPGPTMEEGQTLIGILNKAIAAIPEDVIGSYTIQAVIENPYTYDLSDFLNRYRYAVSVFAISFVIIVALAALLIRQRIRSLAAQADARAKGQFLSTMSHEIRTPLNGLVGLNNLIGQQLDDRERLEHYLRQSSVTAKYLLGLVNDILDMSRIEAQQMEIQNKPVDLTLVISTVAAIVQENIHEKHRNFQVDSTLPHSWILGDEVRIQQVILNLLDNARKFTPEGGRVAMTVGQTRREDGKILTRIDVSDNGQGMSEEFQKHVFHSFAQELDDTVSKGNQGTGLGLPISRNLAQLMGGDVTFTSEKGKGSCFTFTFVSEETTEPARTAGETDPGDGEKPHILIAEDNELNAEIMIDLLENQGFPVSLARNGREALRIFKDSAPYTYDVILMDILMPELDGYQATAAIRALDREDAGSVYIIACTANSFSQEYERAMNSGMNDFISKPVDLDGLLRKIPPVRRNRIK